MLEILAVRYGLDDGDGGLEVLFGGGSAGAMGAHLDSAMVREALPAAAADRRVRLFVDAGWLTDWDDPEHRIGAAWLTDREVWGAARGFWGATFDPGCEAATLDPADCFFGPGWYPFVSAAMPTFVQQSNVDSSFLSVHGIAPEDVAATAAWRAEVVDSLAGVQWLYSGSASYHTLGVGDGFSLGPAGRTLRETLGRFWADGEPERVEF